MSDAPNNRDGNRPRYPKRHSPERSRFDRGPESERPRRTAGYSANLESPMHDRPRLVVSNEQTRDPRVRTQWFFDNMVLRTENQPRDGESVDLSDTRGKFLGSAIYNSHSRIRARLFSLEHKTWNAAYVREAVNAAVRRRMSFFRSGESMRLIFGDADFLPGVVADRLGDVIVIQLLTMAADRMVDAIVAELEEILKPSGFVLQLGSHLREKEGLPILPNRIIGDVPAHVWVPQDGFGLVADPVGGQKTGLFLDQRFNRRLVAPWAGGRRVLDLFCHVAGWGISALTQGADHATCVDVSADALRLAAESAERNGFSEDRISFVQSDVFDFIDDASDKNLLWDLIITDPPAFAKNAHVMESALRGYYSLNYRSMKLLAPNGLLVACSCSQVVSEETFEECLETAARNARMNFQIVARGGQSPDHPILLGFPESRYLKCLVLQRVE